MEITCNRRDGYQLKIKTGKTLVNQEGKIKVESAAENIIIDGPGEYEACGFTVIGIGKKVTGLVYLIKAEEIAVGWAGAGSKDLAADQKELLENADILIIPDWRLANGLKPSLVLPFSLAEADKIAAAAGLVKRLEKKLSVSKLNLPEETEIVALEEK